MTVLYSWGRVGGGERYIIYLWQGRDCSVNDAAASAGLSMEVNAKLCGGAADTIRCTQYHEPPHFLLAFQGQFIVTNTSLLPDSTANIEAVERMYHLRGSQPSNSKALHIPMNASRLNTNDVFVIVRQSNVYLVRTLASYLPP